MGIVITSQRLHAIAFDDHHVVLPGMQNGGIRTVAVGSRDAYKTSAIWDSKKFMGREPK